MVESGFSNLKPRFQDFDAIARLLDTQKVNRVLLWNRTAELNAAKATAARLAEAARTATITHGVVASAPSSRGAHSDAWWHGVAICEQGGRNDSFYGYLSYMDGSAAGKTWEQQVAMGNRTIATYGDHAWAQACINAGYRASPSG